jgi:hypothetical protein
MRFQEKIYNKTGIFNKNIEINTVNTSSEICSFIEPIITSDKLYKIIKGWDSDDINNLSFSGIVTSSETSGIFYGLNGCSIPVSAVTKTKYNYVLEDDNNILSGTISTHTFTGTPSENTIKLSLSRGFKTLGYNYYFDGSLIYIEKPNGVSYISINLLPEIIDNSNNSCILSDNSWLNYSFSSLTENDSNVFIIDNKSDTITFDLQFPLSQYLIDDSKYKFEIYKYNKDSKQFNKIPIYTSEYVLASEIYKTGVLTVELSGEELDFDGDYLLKSYYDIPHCNKIISLTGDRLITDKYKNGKEYGLYTKERDLYFVGIVEPLEPLFNKNTIDEDVSTGSLYSTTKIMEEGETSIIINNEINGDVLVYLNGLMLSKDNDYTFSSNTITFNDTIYEGDVVTLVYVSNQSLNSPYSETIIAPNPISSGQTNMEGDNKVYYNTDTSKYEIFIEYYPISPNDIIVTLNGVTLSNNIDYYQSISNPKRIILEGNLLPNDVINVIYVQAPEYVGEVYTNTPTISWYVSRPIDTDSGEFVVEVSNDISFNNILYTDSIPYVKGKSGYNTKLLVSGSIGDILYYRVVNKKIHETVNGDKIIRTKNSDTVKITIMSNAINSY